MLEADAGVVGLGYMGLVTAVGMALKGYRVVGYEKDPRKRELISQGKVPFFEPGLEEALAKVKGRFTVVSSAEELVGQTDAFFFCVGTPADTNGGLNLDFLVAAVREIAEEIAKSKKKNFVIVVRSTVVPGTGDKIIQLVEDITGYRRERDFGYASFPEFLREGSALEDFLEPHKIILGAADSRTKEILMKFLAGFSAPLFVLSIREAESSKYLDNIWHALKVAFANEVLRASRVFEVDAYRIMRVFCEDTKLNISPAYLRPGFAFGGSCLPKDLKAFVAAAKEGPAPPALPVLEAVLPSNDIHLHEIKEWVLEVFNASKIKKVLVAGLSFKARTDDCRESPAVKLAEDLLAEGLEIRVYDPLIDFSKAKSCFPELSFLRPEHWSPSLEEALSEAEAVILSGSFLDRRLFHSEKLLLDLNKIVPPEFEERVLCPFEKP